MPASDYRQMDLETLHSLLQQQRENLKYLIQTATLSGGEEFASLELRNLLRKTRQEIAELEREIAERAAAPPAPPVSPPARHSDSARLRRLLTRIFSADEFEFFCYDYFRPVYDQFTPSMSQTQRIQRLIDHVESSMQEAHLLALAREFNAAGFDAIMGPPSS